MLRETAGPLVDAHDLVMFDIDGVVHVGGRPVPGVAEHVRRLRDLDRHVAFITNNASRTPAQVSSTLTGIGVDAEASDVVTAAQAAARLVVDRHGPGARVMLLGGEGLAVALAEEGLGLARDDEDDVAVVVSGYGPEVPWRDVVKAATLVRRGVPYVATNADRTFLTDRGLAPGHGVLVRAISDFASVEAVVAGKPERSLVDETVRRIGGRAPLMVGDRLDTDIEGANRVGIASLLVLTGVTGLSELAAAGPAQRPTHLSAGTEGLFEEHRLPAVRGGGASLGGWEATVVDGRLSVSGTGSVSDWWRVAAVAAWQHLDATGASPDVSGVEPPRPSTEHLER